MIVRRKRVMLAAIVTAALAAAPSTATAATSRQAVADISPAACTSASVWLRLLTTTGQRCYTGNGSTVVSLVVSEVEVSGLHTVCVAETVPAGRLCARGPELFRLVPPRHIASFTVSTP